MSAFDLICGKAREIVGSDIVTTGNEDSCSWQQRHFKAKASSPQNYVVPCLTDNREFTKSKPRSTVTATGTSLNKRINEQNNGCASAL